MHEIVKSILITGSNAGIGLKTVKLFAEKGWKVAATMRSLDKAGDLANLENVSLYELDVTSPTSIEKARDKCLQDFGSIDVVVNNAGFGVYGACEISTEEQVDRQFDVNVKGVIRVMKSFLPHFRSQGDGLFVNVSSIAGLITYPLGSLYNSTKWALEGLTEGMFFELKPQGIRVKLVEPGSFGTNFQQVGLEVASENPSNQNWPTPSPLPRRYSKLQPIHLIDFVIWSERMLMSMQPVGAKSAMMLLCKRCMTRCRSCWINQPIK